MKDLGIWLLVLWGAFLLGGGIGGLLLAPPGHRVESVAAIFGGLVWMATIVEIHSHRMRHHPEQIACGGLPWPERLDDRSREGVERISALGFEPVGRLWHHFPVWFRSRPHLVLAAPSLMTYCSLISWRRPPKLYFMTPFVDGACVITANYKWTDIDRPDCIEGWVDSQEPADVLEVHVQEVKRFLDAGRKPIPAFTMEGRVRACEDYWRLHGWKKIEKMATGKDPG